MRIAVISDTHMGTPPAWLDDVYARWLAPADALIHCGDITSAAAWSYFLQHDNFLCVRGNCDWDPELAERLEPMLTAQVGPLKVGVTHGWGPRSQVPVQVALAFGPGFDLVCYGHTHMPFYGEVEGVTLLNPGSLGDNGSLALVRVGPDKGLDVRFVEVR